MISRFRNSANLNTRERFLNGMIAALLIVMLFASGLISNQIAASVKSMAEEIESCKQLLDLEGELRTSLAEETSKHDQAKETLEEALRRIPSRISDSDVLSMLHTRALQSNCLLVDFRPTSTQDHKQHKTRSYDLHMEGEFVQLFRFYDSLRSLPNLYQVHRTSIVEPQNIGGKCRFDIGLTLVFGHSWNQIETDKP